MNMMAFQRLGCSPATKSEMQTLKRKADQCMDEKIPKITSTYLNWRPMVIESQLDLTTKQRQAIVEVKNEVDKAGVHKSDLMAAIRESEKFLTAEEALLLCQRRTFAEDMTDSVNSVEDRGYLHRRAQNWA